MGSMLMHTCSTVYTCACKFSLHRTGSDGITGLNLKNLQCTAVSDGSQTHRDDSLLSNVMFSVLQRDPSMNQKNNEFELCCTAEGLVSCRYDHQCANVLCSCNISNAFPIKTCFFNHVFLFTCFRFVLGM